MSYRYHFFFVALGALLFSTGPLQAQTTDSRFFLDSMKEFGGDYPTDNANTANSILVGRDNAETFQIFRQDAGNGSTFCGGNSYNDCYIFLQTDGNGNNPDGGVLFGGVGQDDVFDPHLMVKGSGEVGVGTTTPATELHVEGGSQDARPAELMVTGPHQDYQTSFPQVMADLWFGSSESSGRKVAGIRSFATRDFNTDQFGAEMRFYTTRNNDAAPTERLRIAHDGNVGLGTNGSLPEKLSVAGNVLAEEVIVNSQSEWADFVFEEGYQLPTLEEVNAFIDEEGHLPDVPSAQTVKEDGLRLGEMDATLLQKIEELTLYTLEQEARADSLAHQVEVLREQAKDQQREIDALRRQVEQLIEARSDQE